MSFDIAALDYMILILVRLASFMAASPVFSNRSIPNQVKVFLSLMISLSVYGALYGDGGASGLTVGWFTFYALREVLLGLAMGFVTQIIYSAVTTAGQFTDFQMGFSVSATFDPMTGSTQAIMGRLYQMVALVLVFITDAHHRVIAAVYRSFEVVPLGTPVLEVVRADTVVRLVGQAFAVALQIATPVILVLLMTDIIMGVLSKTVPSLNILMLGMPMKILIGTAMVMAIFPVLAGGILKVVGDMHGTLERILTAFV